MRMTPRDVLAAWERARGLTLTPTQRASFLARQEVAALCALPPAAVTAAIGSAQRLIDIVAFADAVAWWFRGQECEPDGLAFCARCRPYAYPSVVVVTTGGSDAFHVTETCSWLVEGQNKVSARGGEPASLERVALQVALSMEKQPCLACFPAHSSGIR
ncbi:MAG TPA: hypothetical protein VG455_01205 [Acidimicrobiales bacterium]|nr:hypothetical protein [Acidimicrobiales bacterium]